MACRSVRNGPAKTSRSGIVSPMAPQIRARLPIFLPSVASPMAAPRTRCVSESIAANVITHLDPVSLVSTTLNDRANTTTDIVSTTLNNRNIDQLRNPPHTHLLEIDKFPG